MQAEVAWPRLDPGFVGRVNARLAGEAVLIAQVVAPPRPRDRGPVPLAPEIADTRARWLRRLDAEGRPNEPHALLLADIAAVADYTVVDFATVCALREAGRRPPLLSAGGLAVSRDLGQVLLQRRSQWVSTYQGSLDIIGGAFQPHADGFTGDRDLPATIAREFREETGLVLAPDRQAPAVIAGQLRSGFSGYIQLGLDVPGEAAAAVLPSQEGALVPLDAAGLTAALADPQERWVPTARLHVLTWLALGAPACAPGSDRSPVFPDPRALLELALA
ncbi:MAG: NUDIX domain-containing protein [Alphaproteobacteria bacterium]